MSKYWVPFLLGVVVLMSGCGDGPTPPDKAPSLSGEAVDEGAGIKVEWTALSDVDGYNIYVNGTKEKEVTTTSVTIYGAVKTVEVCGYKGDKEGPKGKLDLTPTISTITVYGRSDPDPAHPSGFGFNAKGEAITYALSDSSNWPHLDFYIEDVGRPISLWSPGSGGGEYNNRESASIEESGTDFDAIDSAASVGNYSTQRELTENAIYSLFMDRDGDGKWDKTNSYFGKAKVLDIDGKKVQLKIAFQKQSGYRMLVTK
jgi:hypothetical protein